MKTFAMMLEQWYEGLTWLTCNGATADLCSQVFKYPVGFWWYEVMSDF